MLAVLSTLKKDNRIGPRTVDLPFIGLLSGDGYPRTHRNLPSSRLSRAHGSRSQRSRRWSLAVVEAGRRRQHVHRDGRQRLPGGAAGGVRRAGVSGSVDIRFLGSGG